MLEDSPGCENKRYQSRRLHKSFNKSTFHAELYAESNDILNATQYEIFNPFVNEKILAVADLVRVSKSSSRSCQLSSREGFVKVEDLPMKVGDGVQEEFQEPTAVNPLKSNLYAPHGPETQFGITESEFVRFSDDSEMDVCDDAITLRETPRKKNNIVEVILEDFQISDEDVQEPAITPSPLLRNKKSIVEAILEDFCSSPYTESPTKPLTENATPIFRFRSKSIRTYAGSKRRRLRPNIDTELAKVYLTDDDDTLSVSSGLSIQEDLTQSVVPQLDTVDLNSSMNVCENLLYLSSYFSQASSHDKTLQSSGEQKGRSLAVVEEIMALKRKSFGFTRQKSDDEFKGFSDGDSIKEFHGFSDERKSPENPFKELLDNDSEDDMLQQINCDSLCYEKEQPKTSFSYVSELESDLERVKSVIEDARSFLQSLGALRDGKERAGSPMVYDSVEGFLRNSSPKAPAEEEDLQEKELQKEFSGLSRYLPPNVSVNEAELQRKISGLPTNLPQNAPVEEEELQKVISGLPGNLWPKAPVEEDKLFDVIDLWIDNECLLNYVTQKPNPKHEKPLMEVHAGDGGAHAHIAATSCGFSTASRKPIAISEEAQRKASELLSKFEQLGKEREVAENGVEAIQGCNQNAFRHPVFQGFTTASRKPVVVSEAGRLKADQILRQFEKEEQKQRLAEVVSSDKSCSTSASHGQLSGKSNERKGKTPSEDAEDQRKSNELSEEVKQKVEELLKDIEFEDGFEEEEKDEETACMEAPVVDGFKTPSRKPHPLSDDGKRALIT